MYPYYRKRLIGIFYTTYILQKTLASAKAMFPDGYMPLDPKQPPSAFQISFVMSIPRELMCERRLALLYR